MANGSYPILTFPSPGRADRAKRPTGFGRPPNRPGPRQQGERLAPQFNRLQEALEKRRIALQDSALGIEPEQVLVLKTVGPVENFFRAVGKVEGLEWLAGYDADEIEPGDGFEDAKYPNKNLKGQLFLIMSDARALQELQRLFELWQHDPEAKFASGLAPLKRAFEHLYEVRPWDVEDRLTDTGLLDDWIERAAGGQEMVPFEAELWFRNGKARRRTAVAQIREIVNGHGGQILSECEIEDIAYHAMLGRIDIMRVRGLLNEPETRRELALFRCDDVMFLRPVGQCAAPDQLEEETGPLDPARPPKPASLPLEKPKPEQLDAEEPLVALLDGLPLTGHVLLDGRLAVDDPDGYEDAYQAREREHGTAMASLICHGDLDAQGVALDRPVYVRPIMQPRRGFTGTFVEAIPENVLPVDLVHRAIVRMFDGEGGDPPASPEIRVVNLSIGDPARPFIREMSGWARLLDWLSWKYNVLFVVSAGNHNHSILLKMPAAQLRIMGDRQRQRLVISALAEDTRNRRLLSPAETLNGLTVGAIHTDESGPVPGNLLDPMTTGMPSVISAHGPGYRRAIKPDIHLPGGRQLLSEDSATLTDATKLDMFMSGSAPGQRVARPGPAGVLNSSQNTRGTSNAAALAARQAHFLHKLLKTLRTPLNETIPHDFEAVLMKTLLVHGAEWGDMFDPYRQALGPDHNPQTFRDYVGRFIGYGQPDFGRVEAGTEQRVTVLGFGSLDDGEAAEFILPLPPSLGEINISRRIIVTLAWFSPINSRRQKYRVAHLWFNAPNRIANERSDTHHHAVARGALQHEVFRGTDAEPIMDGDEIIIKVNCRKDADKIPQPVRFGLAVTLEVLESMLLPIPIYEEVRERMAVRVRTAANAK